MLFIQFSSYRKEQAKHFAKYASDVIISVKKAKRAPAIIAPIKLVAANSIARSTIEEMIVPTNPTKVIGTMEHAQPLVPFLFIKDVITGSANRYAVAMPNKTQRNTGDIAITAV